MRKQETGLFDWKTGCVQDDKAAKKTVARFMKTFNGIVKISGYDVGCSGANQIFSLMVMWSPLYLRMIMDGVSNVMTGEKIGVWRIN